MSAAAARAARLISGLAFGVVLSLLATPTDRALAAGAWWERAGLGGVDVVALQAAGDDVTVRTADGVTMRSRDRGADFARVAGNPPVVAPPEVRSGADTWRIVSGSVWHSHANMPLERDPSSPYLGASAHLLAAPATLTGVVVAVSSDGTVWRRAQRGQWSRALLLLPVSLVAGAPRVTSVTAFTRPLSDAVYLSTDGYSVLLSSDGGDDWIRANPGLPDTVYTLAADAPTRSVYAATSDGVFVHRLQPYPGPAAYPEPSLLLRWLGIALVVLASCAAAAALLARLGATHR